MTRTSMVAGSMLSMGGAQGLAGVQHALWQTATATVLSQMSPIL